MRRTSAHSRAAWRAPALVLGPLALAVPATAAALASGAGYRAGSGRSGWRRSPGRSLASLAGALARGFRHGDWSAFGRYELPDDRDDRMDWASRTGAYAYLRHEEDRLLHEDDDWLR